MEMPGKFVKNKRPSVPLFHSSLTQSAVNAGPARQAKINVSRLNVVNSCSPDIGLDPNSVTNQRVNPAISNAMVDVKIRNWKLAGFLAATRSSLPATERNCIEGSLGFQRFISGSRSVTFRDAF